MEMHRCNGSSVKNRNEKDEEADIIMNLQGILKEYRHCDQGDIDTTDSLSIVIDGPKLKQDRPQLYNFLLQFQIDSMSVSNLWSFAPPDTRGTRAFETFDRSSAINALKLGWKQLLSTRSSSLQTICHKHAIGAVDVYNRYSEKPKLKFERVVAANKFIKRAKIVYVTFAAVDLDTSENGFYQAAVTEFDGVYYLGLLRDHSNDRILAILSLSGAEEDLAALRDYNASHILLS